MEEIKIIEIPASDRDKKTLEIQYAIYGIENRYYIGYESDPQKQCSVLFPDLNWIRKHFGVDKNESSPITIKSLNSGRDNEIKTLKKALKLNCALYDLDKFNDDDTKKTYINNAGEEKEVYVAKLTQTAKELFKNNINLGRLVICKLV